MRIVVDASAIGEYLLRTPAGAPIRELFRSAEIELHVPELTDIEVASGLRSALRRGQLRKEGLEQALADYFDLPLIRHRHRSLVRRVLELREDFSPYDATYVALAEHLETSFLTADLALARAVRRHLKLPVLP